MNQGIDRGLDLGADYVWVLNNDVVVDPDSLRKLVEAGEQNPDAGVIGPVIYSADDPREVDHAGYSISFWTGRLKALEHGRDVFANDGDTTASVDSVLGCSNLIKTSALKKVGRFQTIYEIYFEETDFNVRAKRAGFDVIVAKDAKVVHVGSATMNKFILRRAWLLLRNLFLFEMLNARPIHLLAFIPYFFLIHVPYFLVRGTVYAASVKLAKRGGLFDKVKRLAAAFCAGRIAFEHDGIDYVARGASWRKALNWVRAERAARGQPPRPVAMPKYLELEPTNLCNLRCPGCVVGRGEITRDRGRMPTDIYRAAIDQLADYVLLLILFERGEPFMHDDLCDMIAYAAERGIRVSVSTNGHFVGSEEKAEAIVRSGLDHLIVSLDGATPETYQAYRRGGDFDKVVAGIRTLLDVRNRMGARLPIVDLRFIPMRQNEHEIPAIRKLAADLGVDVLSFKTYNPALGHEGETDECLPESEACRRFSYDADGSPILCTKLWNTMSVRWDGTVVPCNCDYQDDFVLGRIGDQTLPEIWRGDAFADYRKSFRDGWAEHPLCSTCTYAYMKPSQFSVPTDAV